MTEGEPYTFSIDGEVAERITGKWLLRHIEFAKATIAEGSARDEAWIEADKDLKAFQRVLWYLIGDFSYADEK